MKDGSEAAVALAYSALLFRDQGLAAEVDTLENELDGMKTEITKWILRSWRGESDDRVLLGVQQLAQSAAELADAAQALTWPIRAGDELHDVFNLALGDVADTVDRRTVQPGSELAGAAVDVLHRATGVHLIAIRRGGRYRFRTRRGDRILEGDEITVAGPSGPVDHALSMCGQADRKPARVSRAGITEQRGHRNRKRRLDSRSPSG